MLIIIDDNDTLQQQIIRYDENDLHVETKPGGSRADSAGMHNHDRRRENRLAGITATKAG